MVGAGGCGADELDGGVGEEFGIDGGFGSNDECVSILKMFRCDGAVGENGAIAESLEGGGSGEYGFSADYVHGGGGVVLVYLDV